ncbi:MAG: universal stress protein [Ilumatobacteraceae bacterium]
MHNRLVIGYDGSEASGSALRWAVAEAERRSASVSVVASYAMPRVMNVYGIGIDGATPDELARLEASCRSGVETAVQAALEEHPGVGLEFDVVDHDPATSLLAAGREADLVVVGSNGLGPVKDYLFGSVLGTMLHECVCPVVVVPSQIRPHTNRIVVGVDGSAASDEALAWAVAEGEVRQAALNIVHAWEYPFSLRERGVGRRSEFAEVDAALVLDGAMEAAVARLGGSVSGELREGNATELLVAAGEEADLIAVGSRGRGGFHSMLLGSVAREVAARATCPVCVIRSAS